MEQINISRKHKYSNYLKDFESKKKSQRDEDFHGSELRLEISEYLNSTPNYELKEEFKRFKRQIARYNNDNWNKQEQINKELIPALKR
jgi:5S rRNA maturation endonuclease (ribonuclease M5)